MLAFIWMLNFFFINELFIYSCSARLISFEMNLKNNWFQKKLVGQNSNIWNPPPPKKLSVSFAPDSF